MAHEETLHRKVFTRGTHRSRSPEKTLTLVAPFLEVAGITRVAVVTGLDTLGIPVVMVTRPAGRSLSVTQGKGSTLELAKVSGIMEAIEHYHAETIERPLRYASYDDFRSERTVDITRLVSTGMGSTADPCLWIAASSLVDSATTWVPFETVHLDYRLPLPAGSGRFLASSNGLASGNCLDEAIVHGLFEVVERHHAALFYERDVRSQAARRVAISSIDNSDCQLLLDKIAAAGARVALWDLSEPLGVPCFLCDLIDGTRETFRPLPRARGLGCHANKAIALSRAITEAAQSRLTNIAGSRDDILDSGLQSANQAANWHLAVKQHAETRDGKTFDAIPSFDFATFEQERAWLVDRLLQSGIGDPVVIDLSKPGWPVSVVRVVVPGLLNSNPASRVDGRTS